MATVHTGQRHQQWQFLLALALGLVAFFVLPGPYSQRAVLGVFVVTAVLWITEALPLAVTAVGASLFLVVSGAVPAKVAFASLGDPIIYLFIGSFILAKGLETSGLANRMAYGILRQPWATRSLSSMLLAIAVVACALSLFISNTATTVMLLPVVKTILDSMGKLERDGLEASGLLLMTSWASGIAVGTMVATPPNLIGVAALKELGKTEITFVQFVGFGMPVTVVLLVLAWLMLRRGLSASGSALSLAHDKAVSEMARFGRMDGREKVVAFAFAVAGLLWIVPGVIESTLPIGDPFVKLLKDRVPESVAALIGAGLLFILPTERSGKPAMSWHDASEIDWGTILLFAGGIALGAAMFDSGLASRIGDALAGFTGQGNVLLVMALSMIAAVIVSELASNTASATVIVPVSIALSNSAGVSPVMPAIGATLACSLGYMLPVSTPPNALVFSTGYVSGRRMMRTGLWFDIVALAATFGVLALVLPLMGLK